MATRLTATLTDARGPMAGVPVTFTLPSGSPGATFPGGAVTATETTDDQGVAVAPQLTARTTVGTFAATVSADGAPMQTEAMAAQYGFGPFAAPVSDTGTRGGVDRRLVDRHPVGGVRHQAARVHLGPQAVEPGHVVGHG